MAVEAASMAVEVASMVVAGFAAGAASEAEWDSAAAAGFAAARSAGVRAFAEGQDFAEGRSAAAIAVTASAAAGAGRIGVGPDTGIRTDMGTTRGGRGLITRPAMIPTTILTTTLRPPILRLPTTIEMIHTGTTGT